MIPPAISKYLEIRSIRGPWKIEGNSRADFEGAVVIPALAEKESLFATLDRLAENPNEYLCRFLILVVVNHRADSKEEDRIDNAETLRILTAKEGSLDLLQLGWIDAATPGLELPAKGGGVGLARKIGFDSALSRLHSKGPQPLLISLDADTHVRPDYLPAIVKHFRRTEMGGAIIPFCHQAGKTPEQDRAIQRYELFLRSYVLGLQMAGSPYAFHTIGSTMACTAEAYARSGGMNTRKAAEDFYFLQHLAKTVGVAQIDGTVVYPSPRISNRVPFGTGPSVGRLMANQKGALLFYRWECFQILKDWLDLISGNLNRDGAEIQRKAENISEELAGFLGQNHFIHTWERLQKNFHSPALLQNGFHQWFDGLKTLKLIHYFCACRFRREEPEGVLPDFFHWAGLEEVEGVAAQLSRLRHIQRGALY